MEKYIYESAILIWDTFYSSLVIYNRNLFSIAICWLSPRKMLWQFSAQFKIRCSPYKADRVCNNGRPNIRTSNLSALFEPCDGCKISPRTSGMLYFRTFNIQRSRSFNTTIVMFVIHCFLLEYCMITPQNMLPFCNFVAFGFL